MSILSKLSNLFRKEPRQEQVITQEAIQRQDYSTVSDVVKPIEHTPTISDVMIKLDLIQSDMAKEKTLLEIGNTVFTDIKELNQMINKLHIVKHDMSKEEVRTINRTLSVLELQRSAKKRTAVLETIEQLQAQAILSTPAELIRMLVGETKVFSNERTLYRHLQKLVDDGVLIKEDWNKNTRYKIKELEQEQLA